jgi:hypothetical protein
MDSYFPDEFFQRQIAIFLRLSKLLPVDERLLVVLPEATGLIHRSLCARFPSHAACRAVITAQTLAKSPQPEIQLRAGSFELLPALIIQNTGKSLDPA